jgi:hypothetical protein
VAFRGLWFRQATPAEREIIDRARADLWRSFLSGDENLSAAAHLTLNKMLERMRNMKKKFEGSAKDKREDKAEAKKRGMSMKTWEKSAADKKHDRKEALGLAKGVGG